MAKKRELTISEELELDWNDGMYSPSGERQYIAEMEQGLKMMKITFTHLIDMF